MKWSNKSFNYVLTQVVLNITQINSVEINSIMTKNNLERMERL